MATRPETQMKREIIRYTARNDWASFAELGHRLAKQFGEDAVRGSWTWYSPIPNVVYWAGMTKTLCRAYEEALRSHRVFLWPDELQVPLAYLADGGVLDMPLCKRVPKNGYKEPHWLPVYFRPAHVINTVSPKEQQRRFDPEVIEYLRAQASRTMRDSQMSADELLASADRAEQ